MYLSPNIVREIKSRRLRWAGHVANIEESMELGLIRPGYGLLENPCECGIEAPDFISHGVILYMYI